MRLNLPFKLQKHIPLYSQRERERERESESESESERERERERLNESKTGVTYTIQHTSNVSIQT